MAKNVITLKHDPATLAKLRAIYGGTANIQPGQIRLEKVLNNNDSQFRRTLGTDNNAGGLRPTEITLSQNDNFVCTHFAIGLQKVPVLTASNQRGGNAQILHYPDKNLFTQVATVANVSEADALESIYQGVLGMKSDTYEVINEQDTLRYRVVPETQYQPVGATLPTDPSYRDEQYIPFWAPIIFEGKKTNLVTIDFAEQADRLQLGGDIVTGTNVMVVLLSGFTIRNASEAVTQFEAFKEGRLIS